MWHRLILIGLALFTVTGMINAQNEALPVPMIIDTDFAADDWLATLYLLQHPDVDVRAVVLTGTGESHCNPGVQNALNLLELAGHPDIPVTCGRETPLEGAREFPADWRISMDAMMWLPLPTSEALPYAGDAVDLLRHAITASERPPVLLTLGPLTNVADLFTAYPSLATQVERIVIMGGAIHAPGNIDTVPDSLAEWNIYVDPVAAELVFWSGASITLVPLDATNQAPLTMDFVHLLENDRATPSADFAYQVLMSLSGSISSGGFYFWDPLSAGIAADPSLTTIQGRPLRVVTEPGTDSGRTVTDGSGTPIDVAATPDNHRFEQALRNVLNGRQVDAPLPESAASAESETQNLLIVRRVFEEGWGEPNIALLRNLLHTEYTLTGNNPAVSQGADGLLNLVIDLHTLLPDLSVEVESMADAGDMVFARVILRGTLSNPDLGALATSAPVVLVLHSLVRIEQGTIREEWHAVDFSPLMQALTP